MEQAALRLLLQRYRRGECTPAEVAAVEQWYEQLGQERELPQLTGDEQDILGAALWQGIEARLGVANPLAQPARRTARWVRWTAAAALVAGAGLGALVLRPKLLTTAEVATSAGAPLEWVTQRNSTPQALNISLEDGTTVRLAPASSLRYPKHFQAPGRRVQLLGEAFFQVAHNPAQPFQVYTKQVVTTVLGTSFTVRAFADQPEAQVMVHTGKVRVTPRAVAGADAAQPTASVVLLPNQQVQYSAAAPALRKALVAEPAQLTDQSFAFDDRPVAEVLAALESAYGVTIDYDHAALASCTVTLTLRAPSLYGKLDVLCKTIRGAYDVVGTHIQLRAKGCARE